MTWTLLYIRRGDAWDDGRCIAVNEREERCTLPFRHRADEHSTDPSAVDKDPLADVPYCDGHHAMGCCDDPPGTICCWRCTVNPSATPEAFRAALVHDVPGLTPCGDDDCRVCWGDDAASRLRVDPAELLRLHEPIPSGRFGMGYRLCTAGCNGGWPCPSVKLLDASLTTASDHEQLRRRLS